MTASEFFWSACSGAAVVMLLTGILPGGAQGVVSLFLALVVCATVILCARHIVTAINRASARRDDTGNPNVPDVPQFRLPPPFRPDGRRIDPP